MSIISRNICRRVLQVFPNVSARNIHVSSVLGTTLAERPESRVKCTLIPGDGVGPELAEAVHDVFQAAEVPIDFEFFNLSEVAPIMSAKLEDVAASITRNRVCLKGVLQTPDYSRIGELQTLNMKLRNNLDLYANVVHVKSLQGIKSRHQNVDCVIIREQTEGEYSALEYEGVKGVVECLKIVTGPKSLRIAKFAFDYATKNKRKKVTAVHKANIMKLGDGLFLRSCEEIAKLYPKIQFEKMIVDNTTMQMVSNPQQFDVMVTPNLYGNILDNLASGLVGGAGVVAGASYSGDCVIFEPGARHAFTEGAGKGIANPTAMILCSSKLLAHVNLPAYAEMIRNAVYSVIREGQYMTKDMGGQSTTREFTRAVIGHLKPIEKKK